MFGLIWPFVLVVAIQTMIAGFSIHTLSSVRAFVGGESFWSKGQKEAAENLEMFVESRDPRYLDAFRTAIAVPLSDREARLALERRPPDFEAAERGFLGGRNHVDDVPDMVWLLHHFGWISYVREAIAHWRAGDVFVLLLNDFGRSVQSRYQGGDVTAEEIAQWSAQIHRINAELAPHAEGFARSLGEGSRFMANVLLGANLATALALIALAFLRTRKLLSQRQSAQRALNAERKRAQATLASLGEAVICTDMRGTIDYMNAAAERLLGLESRSVAGLPLGEAFDLVEEQTGRDGMAMLLAIMGGQAVDSDGKPCRLVRVDGKSVAVSVAGMPLSLEDGPAGAIIVLHDMTRERDFIARLSWQASHDALTNLSNRRDFEERLETALQRLERVGGQHSLMLLDLDQFKIVNDTCGHAAGDALLRRVTEGLQRRVPISDTLARIGGDEFAVLLHDCAAGVAEAIAEAIRTDVEALDFHWNGQRFSISVSIGLLQLDSPGMSLEEVLSAADVACYMAKEKGRNRVQLYRPRDLEIRQRFGEMGWVQRLRSALDENRFCLFAQEIGAADAAGLDGRHIEVLLRLRDEDGQLVPPQSFIPAAERYGLMPQIDRWVVRTAFEVLSERMLVSDKPLLSTCAINLSGTTFNDETFVAFMDELFATHPVPPQTICFEVTETAAIADLPKAICFMQALGNLGCRFALDDFGSGMSSFGYLKNLPVEYLKIDGSFVKDMLHDRIDRAMVEMVAHLGRVMGKRTIAEFVESDAMKEALCRIGVDYVQGYAIARPVPFSAATVFGTLDREPASADPERAVA